MAKLQTKCWEERGWVRGEQLRAKEGNQSHAFLARRVTDRENDFRYILKSLKRQDSSDRRAMFYVETSAMKALAHSGVLPVEDSNAEQYKDLVELFLITKKAPGFDLEVLIDFGLAHCDDVDATDAETKSDQGKGNRFLIGPEHLPGSTIANRNSATDICRIWSYKISESERDRISRPPRTCISCNLGSNVA